MDVQGLPEGGLSGVRVTDMRLSHPRVSGLTVRLIAPDGSNRLLFGMTGYSPTYFDGDDSDLAGPYCFSDTATPPQGGWWQAARAANSEQAIPAGAYFATTMGTSAAAAGGDATSITNAFAGVTNPNGTWTLRIIDHCEDVTSPCATDSRAADSRGLPEAIITSWECTQVQTCVIHLIAARLEDVAEVWGASTPRRKLWRDAWSGFVPFLDHDIEIRKIIVTTNAIERSERPIPPRGQGSWALAHDAAALNCRYPVTRSLDPAGRDGSSDGRQHSTPSPSPSRHASTPRTTRNPQDPATPQV